MKLVPENPVAVVDAAVVVDTAAAAVAVAAAVVVDTAVVVAAVAAAAAVDMAAEAVAVATKPIRHSTCPLSQIF